MHFSSKKLLELGFEYKYTMEEMFDEAIRSCMEKKLIPPKTLEAVVLPENGKLEVIGEQLVVTKAIGRESEEKAPIATHWGFRQTQSTS